MDMGLMDAAQPEEMFHNLNTFLIVLSSLTTYNRGLFCAENTQKCRKERRKEKRDRGNRDLYPVENKKLSYRRGTARRFFFVS